MLSSNFAQNQFAENAVGGVVKNLNTTRVAGIKIPLPPLDVQTQIIAECQKIDQEYETSRMSIEAYRAKIAKIFSDLEVMAQNQSGMVKLFKIKELCKISSGGTPSRTCAEYWQGGTIAWVKTGELLDNVILDTEEKITQKGLENSSAKIYPQGSLLVAMYGATIGKTALLGIEATTNQACAVLFDIDQSQIKTKFLWQYLISQRENLKALGHGGAQPNLNAKDVAHFSVPIIPLSEQQTIITQIAEYEAEIAKLEQNLQDLPKRKQSVLDKYLN